MEKVNVLKTQQVGPGNRGRCEENRCVLEPYVTGKGYGTLVQLLCHSHERDQRRKSTLHKKGKARHQTTGRSVLSKIALCRCVVADVQVCAAGV